MYKFLSSLDDIGIFESNSDFLGDALRDIVMEWWYIKCTGRSNVHPARCYKRDSIRRGSSKRAQAKDAKWYLVPIHSTLYSLQFRLIENFLKKLYKYVQRIVKKGVNKCQFLKI